MGAKSNPGTTCRQVQEWMHRCFAPGLAAADKVAKALRPAYRFKAAKKHARTM